MFNKFYSKITTKYLEIMYPPPLISRYFEIKGGVHDLQIFCRDFAIISAAKRTVETFDELKINCPLEKKKKLYLAPSEEIFHQVRQVKANTLLLICHNPGLSEISRGILAKWPIHSKFEHVPTCSTCIIDFDLNDWSDLKFGSGTIRNFVVPKDLGIL